MSGFTKLFSSIVTSSIWVEDDATLRVWVAMLATADADGVVEGSVPGFANLARVTVDQMRAAVLTLSSPDPDSRTPDHEGRRIEVVEGGWLLLNYRAYRDRGQGKDGSKAPAMRAFRARRRALKDAAVEQVTDGNALPAVATGEPEAEARGKKKDPPNPPEGQSVEGREIRKPDHIITDPALEAWAASFLDRFVRLHAECRHGAYYHVKASRDFVKALEIVNAYRDPAHLDNMVRLFFQMPEHRGKSTPGQFLAVAAACDAELRRAGIAPSTSRLAS